MLMALGIGGNQYGSAARNLNKISASLLRGAEQMSSGARINRAADDAAGLAISQQLGSILTASEQGVRNLNDGISLVRTAEGSLDQSSSTLTRMRELTVQASNGTLNDADREVIQQEYDALAAELSRVSESTSFNGKSLLNGDTSGSGAVDVTDGSGGDPLQVMLDDHSSASLGVEGLDVSDPSTLSALDDAQAQVSSTRAELGALESQMSSGVSSLLDQQENVAAARSRILDTDYASAAANQTRNLILEQMAIAVHGQANIAGGSALRLLGSG